MFSANALVFLITVRRTQGVPIVSFCAGRQRVRGMGFWVVIMGLALCDGQAAGQCELDKLLASDGATADQFGYSVSISGSPGNEVAIVGASRDGDNGLNSGSAYVYQFGTTNDCNANFIPDECEFVSPTRGGLNGDFIDPIAWKENISTGG